MGWCSDCDQDNHPCPCTLDRVRAEERQRLFARLRAVPVESLMRAAEEDPDLEQVAEWIKRALLAAVEEGVDAEGGGG